MEVGRGYQGGGRPVAERAAGKLEQRPQAEAASSSGARSRGHQGGGVPSGGTASWAGGGKAGERGCWRWGRVARRRQVLAALPEPVLRRCRGLPASLGRRRARAAASGGGGLEQRRAEPGSPGWRHPLGRHSILGRWQRGRRPGLLAVGRGGAAAPGLGGAIRSRPAAVPMAAGEPRTEASSSSGLGRRRPRPAAEPGSPGWWRPGPVVAG
ncbi:uncharacterized protein LOC120667919 [Panicum virgatum]|uniref:Uncharacterized protein n=1 Tax=Panicum virgatum TaxID=38727 RepID=A0A8T0UFX6_PANVG|nr:uncharacterized protein LOC120667919 [Panicum virgatum]KAG2620968.1 hypothetical protein PVAP13_3NG151663 [Panicum virgatum]